MGGEIPKEKRMKRTQKEENQLPDIIFGPEDRQHVWHPHNDALVISAHIQNFLVKKLLINNGSAVNTLSWNAYKAMGGSVLILKLLRIPSQAFVEK